MKISIVVPCFNEEANVVPLSQEIVKQMDSIGKYDYEIIFIDNDSRDKTRTLIREICAKNPNIKAIFNAKNYGQFSSPYYGMLQATGDCAILMCCDFQDPVEMIPKYLEEWEAGYKIILGQKIQSKESAFIYRCRKFYYNFMKKHSDVEFLKQVTGSGLYDRSFLEVMRQVDDIEPFLRGIVAELGFGIKLIPFVQPKRSGGKSSNHFYDYVNIAAQSLTSYTRFGCRLALFCGTLASLISLALIIISIVYNIINTGTVPFGNELLSLIILLAVSMNMFFIGVVGEYVMDANRHTRKRPLVIEEERINF